MIAGDPAAIHPQALVDAAASVGAGTSIDAGTRIRAGARIGADGLIDGNVVIDAGVIVGDGVRIQDGAILYAGAVVEDGAFIGAGAVLTNDRYPRAVTSRGDLVAAANEPPTSVTLRRGCTIGAGSVIVAGNEIGEYATVGAGSVVTHDVAGHALVAGNPARRLGWVCSCGVRLVDDDGLPAGAEPPHYSLHPELRCPSCNRAFVYVADPERVEEVEPARVERPA
jgi:UDP-2-acetamido-3-amino-2,3-dideoxy-glucuronate N-acetyltransferase